MRRRSGHELVAWTPPDMRVGEADIRTIGVLQAQIRRPIQNRTILDGIEGLSNASELVSELHRRTVELRVLCTTRRRQRLPAVFVDVAPLDLEDAVKLLDSRIANPDPQTSDSQLRALCEKLSCLPLAIELAAARHGVLSISQMLERLEIGLGWLREVGNESEQSGHHSSLEQTIGWSYELLSDNAKTALEQASVFLPGFRLDLWERVAGPQALDTLSELHHSSLLSVEVRSDQIGRRYYLLETIRLFASHRLRENHELWKSTILRHAEAAVEIAHSRLSLFRTVGESDALRALESEIPDLDAAVEHCVAEREWPLVARACEILAAYWHNCGNQKRAMVFADRGLDAIGHAPDCTLELKLLRWKAAAAIDLRDLVMATETAERMIERAQVLGATERDTELARSYNLLGISSEPESARTYYGKALALASTAGDREVEGMVRHNVGMLAFESGDIEEASLHWEAARTLREQIGDLRGICETVTNLGLLELERKNIAASRDLHTQALSAALLLRDIEGIGRSLYNIAKLDELTGNSIQAARRYAAAQALFERVESANQEYAKLALERYQVPADLLEQLTMLDPEHVVDFVMGDPSVSPK